MERLRGPIQRFAMRMFQACKAEYPNGNLLIAPFTAATGLMVLYIGANGKTKDELELVLELEEILANQPLREEVADVETLFRQALGVLLKMPGVTDDQETLDYGSFRLYRANKLFIDSGIDVVDDFKERAIKIRADTVTCEFANDPKGALEEMNEYFDVTMNGTMKNCFSKEEINSRTTMVLANGVCFTARWNTTFDPAQSGTFKFKQENGTIIEFPMMKGVFNLPYVEDKTIGITYVEVPYLLNKASLLIFLPHGDVPLKEASKKVTPTSMKKLNQTKRMKEIALMLPKFHMNSNLDLMNIMKKIGIKSLFSDKPDLSAISSDPRLGLTAARHCGHFDVDELGTDAGMTQKHPQHAARESLASSFTAEDHEALGSASSLEKLRRTYSGVPTQVSIPMLVNRSFFFGVRHNKSGIMICLGRVVNME